LFAVFGAVAWVLKTSAQVRLENIALRQQLAVIATFGSYTAEADASRSNFLDLAAACMVRLEIRPDDCQARDGRRLAPEGLPIVLDVENTAR